MIQVDLGRVAAIEKQTLSPWSAESLAQELEIPGGIRVVAETSQAHLLGWCACRVIWPEAELLKITVLNKSREGGIGSALLKHLLAELRIREVSSLFLEVRSRNRPALNFYKKHGFLHLGSRPRYYNNPSDSAMLLEKKLS